MREGQNMCAERGSLALEAAMGIVLFAIVMAALSKALVPTFEFTKRHCDEDRLARKSMVGAKAIADELRGALYATLQHDPDGAATRVLYKDPNGVKPDVMVIDKTVLQDARQALVTGGVEELYYSRIAGLDEAGEVEVTHPLRLYWRRARGELLDQKDNNGNGLVDEGVLVFEDFDGKESVIASGIPENGFRIEDGGDKALLVSVTMMVASSSEPDSLEHTVQFRVATR